MHPIRRPLAILALLLGALLLPAPGAHAQFGMPGMGMGDMSSMGAPVSRRSLKDYGDLLKLDADQRRTVDALYQGYRAAFKGAMEDLQKTMIGIQERFRETRDVSVFQKELPAEMRKFTERLEGLEKGFFSDMRSLLTPGQEPSWVRVERLRRREMGLRFGFVSGQAVDLIDVVNDIGALDDPAPQVTESLDRWEIDIDKALVAFEKAGREERDGAMEMMGNFDLGRIEAMMGRLSDMARGMRDINRQYARAIGPMLPPDKLAAFEREINKRSFPRVYKESYVTKAIGAAEGFNDLEPAQRDALAALKESYERDLDAANRKWASAVEDQEERAGGAIMVMMKSMMGGAAADSTVDDARDVRKRADERAKEKLLGILRPAQKDRLPEEKIDPRGELGAMMDQFRMDEADDDPR